MFFFFYEHLTCVCIGRYKYYYEYIVRASTVYNTVYVYGTSIVVIVM